ncbi:hypothetical protein AOLI_G00180280 [Acnodon oligacanthus]
MKGNPKWRPYWRTLSQGDKLCSHVETALLRRVLITNTLKPIQQELSQQGALILTQTQSGDAEWRPILPLFLHLRPSLNQTFNALLTKIVDIYQISEKEAQIYTVSNGPCDSAHLSSSIFLPELSLDDFLFSDINNFLCELNPCGPNPGLAQGSSSSKVVPMVTDDLRRLTNQPFNTDLNELDKIMEVLVGS